MLEFVAGGWLGLAWVRPEWRRRIAVGLVVGMGLWLIVPSGRFGVMVTLIVAGVLFLEARGLVPRWRLPLLLGDASYSIYLWQLFPVLVVFRLGMRLYVAPLILALIAILVALAGGVLAYLLIERPLLRFFHRRRLRRGVTIPAGP